MVVPVTQIYITLAQEIYPFLERYQCDKPMIPFLGQDLFNVVRGLMQRFPKSDIMGIRANNVSQSARLFTFCVLGQSECVKLTKCQQKERENGI